jgi:hypothetical protein
MESLDLALTNTCRVGSICPPASALDLSLLTSTTGKIVKRLLFFLIFILTCPCNLFANEPAPLLLDMPFLSEGQEGMLDSGQEKASALVISVATWFDNFFDNERYINEENRTRAKLKLSFGYSKNDDFEAKVRINWKLHLPKLSKRVNLIISAGDDDDFNVGNSPIDDPPESDREELTAAIEYFAKTGENLNISTTLGGSYDYLYGGFRVRYYQDFGSWQGRLVDRIRYYTDDGWENKLSFDLEKRLSERWFLRNTAGLNWFEDRDGLFYSFKFRTYQLLSEVQAISYEAGAYIETEPDHTLSDVRLKVRYRQRFYRDWLVLEIAPQLTFPEEFDREPNPGVIVQFEADFGYLGDTHIFNRIF